MEVNKKRIFCGGVAVGILVSICAFIIYADIASRQKLRLPDSADNIFSISVSEGSCDGTFYKTIDDIQGFEAMIDTFQKVEIDFSKPEEWGDYPGAPVIRIVLRYKERTEHAAAMTERTVRITVLGGDDVIYFPSLDRISPCYRGTWPDAENFFRNLDYPCRRLVYCDPDLDPYKSPDT